MTKTNARKFTLLAALLLCSAACGKKDDAVSTPELSASNAPEKIPAAAEVKASSGPVEITFLLHKTTIKAGDYLWHQIRLRNVGEKPLIVVDRVFREPWELGSASDTRYGIYLEALNPDGSPLKVSFHLPANLESDSSEEVSGLLEVEGPEEKAMLQAWKKQGLSQMEIDRKLVDFNMQKRSTAESKITRPAIRLLPGQSAETKSDFSYSMVDKRNGKLLPRPIGEFAQINFFDFLIPGRYKIRAVYDYSGADLKQPRSPDDLVVRTPWIAVTVLP